MARRKPKARRRSQGFGSMLLVALVAAMIIVIVQIKSVELKEKKTSYEKRQAYLVEQIEEQNERARTIEEYQKYITTKQYIEDMARSKLGLVYPDEIIFESN